MTLEYKGGARLPGPFVSWTRDAPRLPGPFDFRKEDLAKGGVTPAPKTLSLPSPTAGNTSIIRARSVSWKLSGKVPSFDDVQQGALANCPVPAILAAMAHTKVGQQRLNNMITEYVGISVKTTLSPGIMKTLTANTANDPDYKGQMREITSSRYFKVALDKLVDVSDVFYIAYSDGVDVDMIYMDSPNNMLWPCVIEKAYAAKIGNYEDLDDSSKHTVNEFWKVLTGSDPKVLLIDGKTSQKTLRSILSEAGKVPTLAASRDDSTRVTDFHGFAALGVEGDTVNLYNPHGKRERIELKAFADSFKALVYGNPA